MKTSKIHREQLLSNTKVFRFYSSVNVGVYIFLLYKLRENKISVKKICRYVINEWSPHNNTCFWPEGPLVNLWRNKNGFLLNQLS